MSTHTQDAYSIPDAARRMGISQTLLRQEIARSNITVKLIATKHLILAKEIDAYLDGLPAA